MTHVEDVNILIRLHGYLKELAENNKDVGGLKYFYGRLALDVKSELLARGIKRTTVMQVKT